MSPIEKKIKKAIIEWYSQKECVKNYYSDRFIEPLGRIRDDVEKRIVLKNVRGRVLDAGCGPGRFAIFIAKQKSKCSVVGIDTSTEMLNLAERTAKLEGISNVEFVKGDIEFLPFKDNTFNSIVSVHVLCHLPQYPKILEEFVRVLKPGGRAVVDMDSGDYVEFLEKNLLIRMLRRLMGKPRTRTSSMRGKKSKNTAPPKPKNPYLDYGASASLNECRDILEKAGARFITKYTFDFPNSVWLINRLFANGKWINRLLRIKFLFKLFSFLEVHILKNLPTQLSPRYFIIAEKNKNK